MVDTQNTHNLPNAEVRRTCNVVMEQQSNITVDDAKIAQFIVELEAKITENDEKGVTGFVFDKWSDWHVSDITKYSLEQITAYAFVVDAMNFCFWPNNPSGEFEYIHITKNLEKVLDTEPEFFSLERLSQVTEQEIREKVFDGNTQFCLIDERARLVRQLGHRL